jgi:hypothetical protein
MTKYLISFPSFAMAIPEEDLPTVAADAHAVIQEAKDAGVYVFGGGINEGVAPVLVTSDGNVSDKLYTQAQVPNGGYTILELPSREAAVEWAAKIAVACRCAQEVREFQYDPES